MLVLDIDLSLLPSSSAVEEFERGYMGHSRDVVQTDVGTSRYRSRDRVGNGHHRSRSGETACPARSDL